MTTLAPSHSFVARYDALLPLLTGLGPSDHAEARARHFRHFAEHGVPTRRDEEFRYLDLSPLEEVAWEIGLGANLERADLEALPLMGIDAVRLVFVNGQFAPDLSSADVLEDGFFVDTLEASLDAATPGRERLGEIATYRGKLGTTNDERFVHLNGAFLTEGAHVHVPRGLAAPRTVHVVFLTTAEQPVAIFPRLLITVEEAGSLKLVESHLGLAGRAFSCPVVEVDVAAGAHVEHIRHIAEADRSLHVGNVFVRQGRESVYTSVTANLGGAVVRHDLNVAHTGSHVETWLDGASVVLGKDVVDNHTRIDHAFPDGRSFETYKTIVDDEARGVFNGKIFVYEDAQRTDAKQTNGGLLMSPAAKFDTKPQLEIFADDVKCTHGATVGQLAEDALFYLRSRGIPEAGAKALLVQAFAAAAFERISLEGVKEELHSALLKKLGAQ